METILHIDAQPDAPIACDMSAAPDTPEQRLAEYARLFAHAFTGRDHTTTTITFRFADRHGLADWVCDLAAREAACCPFFSFDIVLDDATIVWTVSGADRPEVHAILDEYYDAPDWAGQGPDVIAGRMEERCFTFNAPDGTTGYPFAGNELRPTTPI